MSLFELKNVSLAYEEKLVLKEISFSIQEKEFTGILGPNGCGKTTLLKLMTGVLKPNEGSIFLRDKEISHFSRKELAKIVSVLPQETLLDFPFTSLEIVLMGRAPHLKTFQWETSEDLEIAREAMRWTDSLHLANQDVRSLSGGERERVLLARALAQEPQILLLDEPTTHLDLKHQFETHRLLQELNQKKELTLIVVLHDLNFAAQTCNRLLLLADTKLQADGAPQEVLTPKRIGEIYEVNVSSQTHPEKGTPYFFPDLS